MCNRRDCLDLGLYTDKNGKCICENDIILFNNRHYYRCVIFNYRYCLKCLSVDLPLILLEQICMGKGLSSGGIIEKFDFI